VELTCPILHTVIMALSKCNKTLEELVIKVPDSIYLDSLDCDFPKLRRIYMTSGGHQQRESGLSGVGKFLSKCGGSLQHLHMENVAVDDKFKFLRSCTNLETLSISGR
jgi:hypothetical protein